MMRPAQPILASDRVSDVLKQYPHLVDTLVSLAPAFKNLRNPVVRRVQTRLVTVAQAASIAGLEPAVLTRRLNQAAGISPPPQDPTVGEKPTPVVADGLEVIKQAPIAAEIDVRPIMADGGEPFGAIMTAARSVPQGSSLRLIAGFEPLPLYDVLAKQGFTHFTEERGDGSWAVLFYNQPDESALSQQVESASTSPGGTVDWTVPTSAEVTIDISELVPPEPMIKVLETLETLPEDGRLLVHHVRRPIHLYTRLDEMGYAHDTREIGPGQIEVMIQKRPAMLP